jgi:hypothetical protein
MDYSGLRSGILGIRMKLNMGCGYRKLEGWVNVDLSPKCQPDLVCDLESLPWPWKDDSVDEVLFNHSLEHMGQDPRTFLGMMKELYRVCEDQARIEIVVPHPRHDDFIGDPTHVRVITPGVLVLFNREFNDEVKSKGGLNTPLAHYLGVDFCIQDCITKLSEPYATQYREKQLSDDELELLCRERNNVALAYRIVLVARKNQP